MLFLCHFFLHRHNLLNFRSSYKRGHRVKLTLSIFNLLIQICKLSLVLSLSFYYIQIISRYKHIKQVTNCCNLLLCIFR